MKKILFLGKGPQTLLLVLALSTIGCGNKKANNPASLNSLGKESVRMIPLDQAEPGLTIALSEGTPDGNPGKRLPPAKTKTLPAGKTKSLLGRLPALATMGDDQKPFRFRDKSLPPPKGGKVTTLDLVSKTDGAAVPTSAKSLSVLRHAPDGEVPVAPHFSITFSQPMVALSSQTEASKTVPVVLTPQPEGQWRWLGTKTLYFDPDKRMPMATDYQVEIPAETESVSGVKLGEKNSFKFSTPPPTVVDHWPEGRPVSLTPLVFIRFNQKVDRQDIAKNVSMVAGKTSIAMRVASDAEISANKEISSRLDQARTDGTADFTAIVTPSKQLEAGTTYEVSVAKGTPSSEGPKTTKAEQSFSVVTRDQFVLSNHKCGYGGMQAKCSPGQNWTLVFNNPVDEKTLGEAPEESISITPPLPGMRLQVYGDRVFISGQSTGRTTYKVRVSKSLGDVFDQTLLKERTVTIAVGPSEPRFWSKSGLVVLDPAGKPTYGFHSINVKSVKVEVRKVSPSDWPSFLEASEQNWRKSYSLPGTSVVSKTLKIKGENDRMAETFLDLSAAFNNEELGHAIVKIAPVTWKGNYKPQVFVWVQRTKLGLDAFVDNEKLLAWTTALSDGSPISDVDVSFVPTKRKQKTDKRGVTVFDLKNEVGRYLVAKKGTDTAILPYGTHYYSRHSNWQLKSVANNTKWFIFDDRGMYKPGETVSIKGWLREENRGLGGGLLNEVPPPRDISYKVSGPRGNEITKGSVRTNGFGGFFIDFKLPKDANLGYANISFGGEAFHSFQIQEFRRPEFEVATEASPGPYLVGTRAKITAKAKYYAGGALKNAPVRWSVQSSPSSFRPPNRDDYTFGFWTPWWSGGYRSNSSRTKAFSGQTSSLGSHTLQIDLQSINPPRPMSVVATGTVSDVNRQAFAGASTLLVHPSSLYVGLKREKYFVSLGTPMEVDAIVVDHDGKAASGHDLTVTATRLEGQWKNGEYKEEEKDPQRCEKESGDKPSRCTFKTDIGGRYRVKALVKDKEGRPNQTQFDFWVSGGEMPTKNNVEQEEVTLIPDKETYEPGEVAKILVQSPFSPAEGLVTLRRAGIVHHQILDLKTGSATLDVKITENHIPNLHLQVDAVGSAPRGKAKGPRRPAFAMGNLKLSVSKAKRKLTVKVTPSRPSVAPGTKTEIDVAVLDSEGKAVSNAEVALVVVDESVLALTGYKTPDPLSAFYQEFPAGVANFYLRTMVALSKLEDLADSGIENDLQEENEAQLEGMPMEAMSDSFGGAPGSSRSARMAAPVAMPKRKGLGRSQEKKEQSAETVALRKNFAALAVFAPTVTTDAKGLAKVSVKVPDNLTRYRVMAVAVAGAKRFGSGEANLVAQKPLMVRPSPPRFLNFGDSFQLPITIQNQTDVAMGVQLAMRATNLTLSNASGVSVRVPANDRVEVRLLAKADKAGVARAQVIVSGENATDAAEFSLPVWTPATTEAFATYGVLDNDVTVQAFETPKDATPLYGGLSISTSSTQLQELTDAFLYIVSYPYECAEQTSSRLLGMLTMRDVLYAFNVEGAPDKESLREGVTGAIERLQKVQNPDGGFSFWVRGRTSWPYLTIYAGHALNLAKAKGYKVDEQVLSRAFNYIKNIERHIPHYYSRRTKNALKAFALWVRASAGDIDGAAAKRLWKAEGPKELSMESVGWTLGVLGLAKDKASTPAILKFLQNRVEETAGNAHWTTNYTDGAQFLLHSSRRADAVVLAALMEAEPKSDLIPKVIRGLLAHRKKGRWSNTQENTFVLMAMDTYFSKYEGKTPAFKARAWLGNRQALEASFRGRETKNMQVVVPMDLLAREQGRQKLTLQAKGTGRMYYRLGVDYAPKSLRLKSADYGFSVTRQYEAIDDDSDVVRDGDKWKIRAGARVRVRLTMVAPSRRYHVALVDPLPAGLEPLNPAIAVTGDIPTDPSAKNDNAFWWWSRPWYEHQNMRDERVEAFASLLWEGVHEYSYVARATTPGTFVVPPTRAEEMYSPETFGRSSTDLLTIE